MSVLMDKLIEIAGNLPDCAVRTINVYARQVKSGGLSQQAYIDLVEAIVMAHMEMNDEKDS